MQSRNGDADVENKLMDTKRGRKSGKNWEVEIDIYTCIKFSRQEYWSGVPLPSPMYKIGNY